MPNQQSAPLAEMRIRPIRIEIATPITLIWIDSGSQGYEQDPEMRSAVELCRIYRDSSLRITRLSSEKVWKPFDLLCKKEGESIHVEVKGSRSKLDTVILTINEVSDAENAAWQSDLFVVDQIVVERIGQDLVASGGGCESDPEMGAR